MQIVTWLSVIVLGPGSIAIFVWFLLDLKRILGKDRERSAIIGEPNNSCDE